MTYELARQLKDAGWEFQELHSEAVLGKRLLDSFFAFGDGKSYYAPTLSELIAACASILFSQFSLEQHSNDWRAGIYRGDRRFQKQFCSGKTPEEAVAKLYLALQPQK